MLNFIQNIDQEIIELSTSDYVFLILIQVFLLLLFALFVNYFCRTLKAKEPEKSTKKACIVIWIISAIAWFIISQIVLIVTASQFAGN